MIAQIISVFAVAFLSLWGAFPAGVALGVAPAVIAVTAGVSYAAGVALVLILGQPVRDWLMRRGGSKLSADPNSTVRKVWDRYGLIGLALLAPITTGSQIGAVVALALNAPPRRVFVAMALGACLWCLVLALALHFGLVTVQGNR